VSIAGLVKRSVTLTCAWYMLDDWRARRRLAAGRLETTSGTRHAALDLVASLAYIERVHGDYLGYAGVEGFSGTIAEIGPGDNFGVALLLLAGGAQTVHTIDRYRPARNAPAQAAIYAELSQRHGLDHLFDGAPGEATLQNVIAHAGEPAETFFRDHDLGFDAIVSRAVLEHLYDPLGALDDMAGALNPGGRLVHRIDLRDHGMFTGHHPLTFLTPGAGLYSRMTRGAGRPNRVLAPRYRDWLANSGLKGDIRVTRLAGVAGEIDPVPWDTIAPAIRETALGAVRRIRPKLAAPFRAMTDEDLAISGIVLSAKSSPA
jgi:SAM-dependent methyltransferase